MRTRSLSLLALAVLCGCPSNKKSQAAPAELVSQARTQLAERERKLVSYRFHGSTTDLTRNQSLGFKFLFRSPDKMRGETEGAQPHVFVFDGKALRDLDVSKKKLTTYDLSSLPKAKADAFLHEIFAPFAPEGFRAPLLPGGPLQAETRLGEGDKKELWLSGAVADGAQKYEFSFLFALPAMDLVQKDISAPDGKSRIAVTRQSCDPKLGLCFPAEVLETRDGKPVARTVLSDIEVNGAVADADFALAVPPGGTEEKKSLASAP